MIVNLFSNINFSIDIQSKVKMNTISRIWI